MRNGYNSPSSLLANGETCFILDAAFMEISNLPTLRPLRLGELFDQAIRLYRQHFLTYVGIMAVVYIPYVIVQTVSSTVLLAAMQTMRGREIFTSPAYWLFIFSIFVGIGLNEVFVSGLGTAALTNATAHSYLNQKISILDSYRQLGNSWLHLLFAMLIVSLLSSLLSTWAIVPIAGWFTGLGAMIFLAAVVAELLPPIIVIEKSTWLDPIKRAWDLGRRRFWWLLGVAMIFSLFTLLISTGPTLIISAVSNSLAGRAIVISTLISTILGSLLHLITLPILIVAKTLIYFDLRIRTEGFDLALATLEASEGAEIDIASLPIPVSDQKWLTWDDVSKFLIITLVILGLIALAVGIVAIVLTFAKAAL